MRKRLWIAAVLLAESCLLATPGTSLAAKAIDFEGGYFVVDPRIPYNLLWGAPPLPWHAWPKPYNPKAEFGLKTVLTGATTGDAQYSYYGGPTRTVTWSTAAAVYGSDTSIVGATTLLHKGVEPMADTMAELSCGHLGIDYMCQVEASASALVHHRVIVNANTAIPDADRYGVDRASMVPVIIAWNMDTKSTNTYAHAEAGFQVSHKTLSGDVPVESREVCSAGSFNDWDCPKSADSGFIPYLLKRSTADYTVIYSILATAHAFARDWGATGSFAQAVVDPFMYVDPSWEYAKYFSVQQASLEHPGEWVEVTRAWQTNPVPEPQTMLLLCAGLLGLGGWQRLRRAAATHVA